MLKLTKNISKKNKLFYLRLSIYSLLIVFIASCKCNSIAYNSALNNYSQGAIVETQQRFQGENAQNHPNIAQLYPNNQTNAPTASHQQYYATALTNIEKALEKKRCLKQDGTYGTALSVKALILLGQGKYDPAINTSLKAIEELRRDPESTSLMRDLAVMSALQGIASINYIYDTLTPQLETFRQQELELFNNKEEDFLPLYNNIKVFYQTFISNELASAHSIADVYTELEKGIQIAKGERNDVNKYLLLCQLSADVNWKNAISRVDIVQSRAQTLFPDKEQWPTEQIWLQKEWDRYDETTTNHLASAKHLLPEGIYQFFEDKLSH